MKPPSHLENRTAHRTVHGTAYRTVHGAKLISPSSERNKAVIGSVLAEHLSTDTRVLEIASGTGQHGDHLCRMRPDIKWQYSDIDEEAMNSQRAYGADLPAQLSQPIRIDTMEEKWWQNLTSIDAIYCANMIHIAPWEAAIGLAKGAGALLSNGGNIFLYGPFLLDDNSAPSNLSFDISLKQRNPRWGVRNLASVKHIFADAGLSFVQAVDMPRDNFLLIFERD